GGNPACRTAGNVLLWDGFEGPQRETNLWNPLLPSTSQGIIELDSSMHNRGQKSLHVRMAPATADMAFPPYAAIGNSSLAAAGSIAQGYYVRAFFYLPNQTAAVPYFNFMSAHNNAGHG